MHLRTRHLVAVKEPFVRVPTGLLVVGIHPAVKLVGSRFGGGTDLCSAVGSLRSIVHRGVHVHFRDRFRRRRWQCLTDRTVDRSAGSNLSAGIIAIPVLTDIDRHTTGGHLAGGFAIEDVVSVHAIGK